MCVYACVCVCERGVAMKGSENLWRGGLYNVLLRYNQPLSK